MLATKSGLLVLLLHAIVFNPVASMRLKMHSHELDEEHQEVTQWPVTDEDRGNISEILKILNPPGADVPWKWQDSPSHWWFGLVKLTSQDAKGALVLHMLHRHGLGPLLASRAGEEFTATFQAKLQTNVSLNVGNFKAKALVEAQEEFGQVQHLRKMLESLTLGGLRNLHSYDHQWSVDHGSKGANKQAGCSQFDAGGCVLQAGYSRITYNFLRENGFTPDVCEFTQEKQMEMIVDIFKPSGYSNLDSYTRDTLAQPQNTGDITVTSWGLLVPAHPGNRKAKLDVGWEGGARTTLDLPIHEATYELLSKGNHTSSQKKNLLAGLVDKYIEAKLAAHKKYMSDNRLTLWAGEEAEFCELHNNLPEFAHYIKL